MKKLIALLLCIVMCMSLFVACGPANDGEATDGEDDGRTTITIGIPRSPLVQDYETNKFTLWLEETTGYNIEFEYFTSSGGDYASQLSTRISGGMELPDILWGFNLGTGVRSVFKDYGDSGFIIDLKEYYDDPEKSATFWDRLEKAFPDEAERQHIVNRMTDQEHGAMYAFPTIEVSAVDQMSYQVYINQAWLTKLGLEMPTDNESLLKVLEAFRDQDPNGNGEADELPLIATNVDSLGSNGIRWLQSLFVGGSMTNWFNVDEEGQVYMPWVTDEYRQALCYIKNLHDTGLMSATCWTMNTTDVTNLLNPTNGVNRVGIFVGHPSVVFEYGTETISEYEALPLWSYAVEREPVLNQQYFISSDCENPDAAWEIFMAACSEEGSKRQRYGEKGVDWLEPEEGALSYLGWEADMILVNDIWGTMQNQHWGTVGATININAEGELCQIEENADAFVVHKREIMKDCYDSFQRAKEAHPVTIVPTILRNKEQADATTVERTNVENYIKESMSRFCLGTAGADPNDDAQWASYLTELDRLGLKVYYEQTQEIYDAMPK